ncbi:9-O-acetylesterase, partial [bacterium]
MLPIPPPSPVPSAPVETTLSPIFSDSMVLQRGKLVPVFGTDAPGTEVRVQVAGKVAKARAGADGRWTAMLPKMEAGGPFTLTVQGTATRSVKDVLVGEVWVCSGQSNMEWT